MKFAHKFCAWICAALLLVPLAACSKGNQKSVQAGTLSGDQSAGTQIVGKVTSVVGNQVTLAIGTLKGAENRTSSRKGYSSSAVSSASSSAASEKSGNSSSSGLIALTGETKTLLIPVGLTLAEGGSESSRSSGTGGSQGGSQGNAQGSASAGGFSGGSGRTQAGSGGKSGGSGGTAGAAQMTQRTRDFSSITKGMILQITEKTLSDGTQGIVKVAVLSE
ncbi:hypothetical protein EQM14_13910 [Caproiciproducens sp. NJN-50]|uniref:hypothetical protein n=1 Tax=Acutalibacteraceae TaxID=3082771 RepID=UPI000FFE0011|nr:MULTISPECIES: hypothetical protein [Acutalibacteraceae]QAT50772.1 hypothetical protein EQM14_13910 [Caproiciproducens sp. NJN-50]